MSVKFMRCITLENGGSITCRIPLIPAGAGNSADNTNMGHRESDISEFGSILGKIFYLFLFPDSINP
jgi:hypothetical protein